MQGNETLGYGVNDQTFEILEKRSESDKFVNWLENQKLQSIGGRLHPDTASHYNALLPLLKGYYASQEETWEDKSRKHMLSFLLGSWEERVYWFEVVEVIRR